MPREQRPSTDESNRTLSDWSRRTVLKITGGGVALAGLAGSSVLAQEDGDEGENGEEDGDENGEGTEEQNGEDDSEFVDDLIDPTWGYPLAANETDSVDIQNVVELVTEEGEGQHENFPVNPVSGETVPFEFYFDPVGVHLQPDAVVQFVSTAGEHTATAFHEKYSNPEIAVPNRIPEGVVGFTSPPVVDDESWLYQFETKGVYDVLCLPHLPLGMVMRAVVFDPEEDDIEDETFAAPTGGELPPSTQQVFDAPELEPANIVEEGAVAWADLSLGEE